MYKELEHYIRERIKGVSDIPENRKHKLQAISRYIRQKVASGKSAEIIFICTHNSRRSHLAQVWASTCAHYFDFKGARFYSGGTEETAFNPRAVDAIRRAGFTVSGEEGANPVYKIYFDDSANPLQCFSKTYDDSSNPSENFSAVMTCTDADENCPVILGAENRFSLPYRDPKESDGTPRETEVYDERCREIAREMAYLISEAITDNSNH